ncbi:MAG: DNA mismatch repair protein MutS [Sandaracinaceae bacterium]|nr:DNA mismatch repair protein MutS [Sandaracinaceae bacterium]
MSPDARENGGKHTPVMQQFFRAKDQYPDAILFFRMGDFYEMFYEDAVVASQLLDLTLTSRNKHTEAEQIPMAGVPHHAAAGYIARLLEKGQRVAICEQMADPSKIKGIVPREVVRVITPGLVLEVDALDARAHNYLVAVCAHGEGFSLAALELSTSELRACFLPGDALLVAELVRLDPRELLVPAELGKDVRTLISRLLPRATIRDHSHDAKKTLAVLGECIGTDACKSALDELGSKPLDACAAALSYAHEATRGKSTGIRRISAYDPSSELLLDEVAVRNLELVRTLGGDRKGSLLHLIDETCTAIGARTLRRRLLSPLTELTAIRARHDAVAVLVQKHDLRAELRTALNAIPDLERLATRASLHVATPRDMGSLRQALVHAREVCKRLGKEPKGKLGEALAAIAKADLCDEVLDELETALQEDLPLHARDGGVFRGQIDARVDELRQLSSSSKDVILRLEESERERTGISSLKIRFTRVFGYYIEITKKNLESVPEEYRRKQTVAGAERYTTPALEELQSKILNADERLSAIETELFEELRKRIGAHAHRLHALAARLGELDVHASLAEVAHRHGYVRPTVDDSLRIALQQARHPVVERFASAGVFVPNDVGIDAAQACMLMITGPNMSGKSTVMRQTALAVILAQAGSFVPAKAAHIGVVDRIFTRVGASDNLGAGQSTFMVEMQETATMLRAASSRSLVLLDEIGRGTSTYDGLSIAWAVAEHLHDHVNCRAMFATHYHELCELSDTHPRIANMNVSAKEQGDEVVFLHKLIEDGASHSYGIAVAKLAGVPDSVLARARQILRTLEDGKAPGAKHARSPKAKAGSTALSVAEEALRQVDIERMTPVEALVELSRIKALVPGDNR